MNIQYGRQSIDEDDIQAVIDVLRGDFLTTGPMVTAFEKAVCDYKNYKRQCRRQRTERIRQFLGNCGKKQCSYRYKND